MIAIEKPKEFEIAFQEHWRPAPLAQSSLTQFRTLPAAYEASYNAPLYR